MQATDRDIRHWQEARRITAALLLIWGVVTFGATFFARELDFQCFGFPFGYWVAAQGALWVYLALIATYAWTLRRLDVAAGGAAPDG